jgi:hypothetical protein
VSQTDEQELENLMMKATKENTQVEGDDEDDEEESEEED